MTTRESVDAILLQAIEAINAQLPAARRLGALPSLALAGPASNVESLTLMGLIVDAEDRLMDAFGVEVPLADMLGMPPEANPFRSLDALGEAIAGRIDAG